MVGGSAIHILKCHGKSSLESHMVNGFALAGSRAAQGMPSVVKDAKIALLDFGLQRHKLQLGVQVREGGQQQQHVEGRHRDATLGGEADTAACGAARHEGPF